MHILSSSTLLFVVPLSKKSYAKLLHRLMFLNLSTQEILLTLS